MVTNYQRKDESIAWTVSIVIHALLLLCFFLWIIWQQPNPPTPQVSEGVMINFGTSDVGMGDNYKNTEIPTETKVTDQQQVTDPTQVTDPNSNTTEQQQSNLVTGNDQSQTVDQNKNTTTTNNSNQQSTSSNNSNNNQSDGTGNQNGNQGDKNGTLNPNYSMGHGNGNKTGDGTGNGDGLALAGWDWDSPPQIKDESDATGTIKFYIRVDEDGNIDDVRVMPGTNVSALIIKKYEAEVRNLSFHRTSNGKIAPSSSGTITFKLGH